MWLTSRTIESLRGAIAGEFNAKEKYLKFAEIAVAENFPNVAYLFRSLAMAEGIHLKNHRQALGENLQPEKKEIKSGPTLGNVQNGVESETWEYNTMYPGFIKAVQKEKKEEMAQLALLSMGWARNVENAHAKILSNALKDVQSGKDANITKIWLCKVCGNLVVGDKPMEICEVCKHDKDLAFLLMER